VAGPGRWGMLVVGTKMAGSENEKKAFKGVKKSPG